MERDDDPQGPNPRGSDGPQELDLEQLRELRALRVDVPPSAEAEAAVLRALRAQGMLPRARRWAGRWPLAWPATAGVAWALVALVFVGGVALGRWGAPARTASTAPATPAAGSRFLLLLYEDRGFQRVAPAAQAQRAHEYGEWARGLGHGARFVDGEELAERGRLLEPDGVARPWQPADAVPTPGVVAGFFLIEAADLEAAEVAARGCPHLSHGGRIEVRPLVTRSGTG